MDIAAPSLLRAALIGGLDAEAKATAHQRMRNFAAGEAARPAGKPRIYSCSVRALAHREGIMRDAAWSGQCERTITSIRATCPRSSSEIAQVLSNGFPREPNAAERSEHGANQFRPWGPWLIAKAGEWSKSINRIAVAVRLVTKRVESARLSETKTGDVTGINVISLAWLFTMRTTHGQLIAKLVCTSYVCRTTRAMSSDEGVPRQHFSRGRLQIGRH